MDHCDLPYTLYDSPLLSVINVILNPRHKGFHTRNLIDREFYMTLIFDEVPGGLTPLGYIISEENLYRSRILIEFPRFFRVSLNNLIIG